MLNQWLCVLFQSSCGIMFGYSLGIMLPKNEKHISEWKKIISWFLLYFMVAVVKILPNQFAHAIIKVTFLVFIAVSVFLLKIFYGGPVWKRWVSVLLLFVAQTIAEVVVKFTQYMAGFQNISMDYTQTDMVIGSCFTCMIGGFFMILLATVWKQLFHRDRFLRHTWFWTFFLFLQMLPVYFYYKDLWGWEGELYVGFYAVMFISYVGVLITMILLHGHADKEETKQQLKKIHDHMSMERIYYEQVEEQREVVAKIRHDYNNQLSSVLALLHMGKTKEAETMLVEALDKLEVTKEEKTGE